MRWPWRDLLFLHGHIVDHALARRLADLPEQKPIEADVRPPRPSLGQRSFVALRLCLGIGDGTIRTQ